MPITYARYVHRKPEPDPIPATFEELEEDTILLFDPVAEGTVIGIGDLYRRLDLAIRASEIVVFRGADPSFVDAVNQDPLLPDNLRGKLVLALVGSVDAANPAPALLPVPAFAAPTRRPLIENLRQAELTAILQRSDAIFTSNEYHYELPSGLHAEKFVRLADALRSVFDIRRVTDWLLPYLAGDTLVLADTGSMLPLLIDLREQARLRFGWKVEISTLDRYPQDAVTVSDAIAAVRNRPMMVAAAQADLRPGVLFLISVNSSGRLCQLFRALGPENAKIVVVCQTSEEAVPCDDSLVAVPIVRWPVTPDGTCDFCKGSPLIRVHPESYELLPSIKRETIRIDKPLAESMRPFWTIADEADAVRLHVDVPYYIQGQQDYRHFGVYLDIAKLALHATFRSACVEQLRKIASPEVVLIPLHQTSDVVAKLCLESHPGARVYIVPPGRLATEVQDRLTNAKRILVADDAIVTGFTLLNLRTEVFRATQHLGVEPEVNAFVVVSRPATENPVKAISRRYRGRSVTQVLSGASLLLPEGRHCPWCAEHRLLSSIRSRLRGAALAAAEMRIRKLEGQFKPPLLMVNADDARGDLLTLGSFFGNLRHEAAFAAGVCAAQNVMQQVGTLGGGIRLKVIDLAMAIDAYYEGVLLASLLRTVNGIHVRFPGSDPLVEQSIRNIDVARAYPGVVAELALAAIDNKLPNRQLRAFLERGKSDDQWLLMLADIMDAMGST